MEQGSPVLGVVGEYCVRRKRVNAVLLQQIQQIFDLDGFTGSKTLGCRKGSQAVREEKEVEKCDQIDNDDLEGEDADDVDNDQIDGILDFVASL